MKSAEIGEDDVRIHLVCENVFLSLSLSFYLRGHLSSIDTADFILTDAYNIDSELPICRIGRDFLVPCSVYDIFSQLHDFYSKVMSVRVAKGSRYGMGIVGAAGADVIQKSDLDKLKMLQANPDISPDVRSILDELAVKLNNTLSRGG